MRTFVLLCEHFSPPPVIEPRQPFHQMARMMDSLINDPFVPTPPIAMSKMGGMSRSVNHLSSAGGRQNNKPIGPVRPRLNQNLNSLRRNNTNNLNNNLGEIDYSPASNPNNAGERRSDRVDYRTETQRAEDCWKASLRKRDPDLQPTLPNIPTRSR